MPTTIIIREKNSGQVLIIILLVMLVGLTTGLLLLGRTTSDVSLTNKIEESSRAFNAAEAGIEEAIYSGVTTSPLPLPSGVSYQVNLTDLTAVTGAIFPAGAASQNRPTTLGNVFTVWLVPHNDVSGAVNEAGTAYRNPLLDICFSSNSPSPALGITAFYRDNSVVPNKYRASFVGYDPDNGRNITVGANGNKFKATASSLGTCGTNGYSHRVSLQLNTDFGPNLNAANIIPLALRIRPFYANTTIAVVPAANTLPKQGNQIVSTGQSGGTARRISVNELYVVPAPFLDHALFNTGVGNISK